MWTRECILEEYLAHLWPLFNQMIEEWLEHTQFRNLLPPKQEGKIGLMPKLFVMHHQERDSPFGLVNALRGGTELCTKGKVDQVLHRYSIITHFLDKESLVSFAAPCKTCCVQCMVHTKPPQVFLVMGYGVVENHVWKLMTKSNSRYLVALWCITVWIAQCPLCFETC